MGAIKIEGVLLPQAVVWNVDCTSAFPTVYYGTGEGSECSALGASWASEDTCKQVGVVGRAAGVSPDRCSRVSWQLSIERSKGAGVPC